MLCVVIMGLFSGDSVGCLVWLLKKHGAETVGGLRTRMPDSVCDVELLKKSPKENQEIIREADRKIEKCAEEIRKGGYPRNDLHLYNRIAELLYQRLWYCDRTENYSGKLRISNARIGCSLCTRLYPIDNLIPENDKVTAERHYTMCHQCISLCPAETVALLGRTVTEQCRYDRYVKR